METSASFDAKSVALQAGYVREHTFEIATRHLEYPDRTDNTKSLVDTKLLDLVALEAQPRIFVQDSG